MFKGYCAALIVALVAVTHGMPAQADDLADQGRALLEAHRDAVVTVSIVIKLNIAGGGFAQDNETKTELTGTVIDESGLTVVSLSESDPSSLVTRMMGGRMQGMNISSEITDAKILMRDGSEVPMIIVLRDKDLDLAFLRPSEALEEPMAFVAMDGSSEASLLDQLFVVNRLGRVAGRAHSVSIERIEAVVNRPRRFYIPGKDPTNSGLGCPAFNTDGNLVGFMVLRAVGSGGGGGMMSMMQDGIAAIILPAEDVAEVALQAPSAEEVAAEVAADEEAAAAEEDTTEEDTAEESDTE